MWERVPVSRAGLAMSDGGSARNLQLEGQLAASERRVEEMDKKMATLIQQQAKLMEMLGAPAEAAGAAGEAAPPSSPPPSSPPPSAAAPAPPVDEEAANGEAENPTLFKGAFY